MEQHFTKYEIARVIGARALQIAMDAPLLLKISEEDLKEMKYDTLEIAEREFEEGVLPIAISRPIPRRKGDKLRAIKEEKVSDEEIKEKEKELEKEIVEDAEQMGLVEQDEDSTESEVKSEEQ